MTLSLLNYDPVHNNIIIVDVHFHFTQHCFFCLGPSNFDLLSQKESLPLNTFTGHILFLVPEYSDSHTHTPADQLQWI